MNRTYELYHHGILGMKWGVRRYQNKDGSLTEAGKKRLEQKSLKRDGGEYQKKETEFNKEMVIARGDYKEAVKHMEVFTEQELDTIITRAGKAAKLRDLSTSEVRQMMDDKANTARNKIDKFKRAVEVTKGVADLAMNLTNMYNSVAKASNTLMGSDLPVIGEKKETKRGSATEKDVTYQKIEGDLGKDYVMKITKVTTKNTDGTTSVQNYREMERIGKKKKGGGGGGSDDDDN